MIGIYKIENLTNHKVYIGQSKNISQRWIKHRIHGTQSGYNDADYPLYRAMRKYGIENFSFSILEECSIEELNEKEQYWIKQFNSYKEGYNQTNGGEGGHPLKLTEEQVLEIYQKLQTEERMVDIAQQYNVSHQTISEINLGYIWVHKDIIYPIRKKRELKQYLCLDCGMPISKGATRCKKCNDKLRITQKPVTREELKKLIRTKTFVEIGTQFNVTDNAIRKWCDKYNLPRKKSDIKKFTEEEWEKI